MGIFLRASASITLCFCMLAFSNPVKARTIHRCVSYRTTSGKTLYRVTPSITGAYGNAGGPSSRLKCFVPVSSKQCFYRQKGQGNWRKCGMNISEGGGFRINYSKGDGEIVEDRNGKRFHAFSDYREFYFD